jgi:ABC-type cobalamin/Fe3+-siderophores transport system ATPase subunit
MNPTSDPIRQLAIRRGGLAYNDRVVLQNVNVRFDAGHLHLLYGSGGAGKSSLLRALAGHARRLATMRVWGDWLADGRAITAQRGPTLVHQQPSSSGARVSDDLRSAIPERASLTIAEQWTRVTDVLMRHGFEGLLERRDEPV